MEEPCVSKNSWENRSNENRTGHSPDLFCFSPLSLLGLYSCLALCISLGSRLFFAYPAQVHRCPAPPPLLNICSPSSPRARGSYPPRHPYDRLCRCLPSIWSKGTAAERSCVPASIAAWMRNGEKNKHPAPSAPPARPERWAGRWAAEATRPKPGRDRRSMFFTHSKGN